MNLHEYQAKQLFAQYGLPISEGKAVDSGAEAIAAAKAMGGEKWAVKAHSYLILHGRYVCKAKKFDCQQCVILKECEYPDKNK